MTFSYYARLSRAQQAVYRQSDAVTTIRLERAAELQPLVSAVAAALATQDRAATQQASERLVRGLTHALGMPAVRVEVLAARPHARWGELHGLYTAERGRTPTIQLWMRTAKQKRVVAFRTYLRTLLHEVGHHIDFTALRLPDSFHTEGFYKRESSLFAQLVPEGRPRAATFEEWSAQPADERMRRLSRTPDQLTAALNAARRSELDRRPAPASWAPVEVLAHLLDSEELFVLRVAAILAMNEPALYEAGPADRWAHERQYLRYDGRAALAAFRTRRGETLELLMGLAAADWRRGAIHPARGRMTIDTLVSIMAWHDDNHHEQLTRALEGKP
ncbi:MAG TPA: DinB family protein [Candidatus Limnocylindria bacterium]|nr:DinB family protein [Candidatus Limnocylindria bacterium]